jgi:cell division protein FtsQ
MNHQAPISGSTQSLRPRAARVSPRGEAHAPPPTRRQAPTPPDRTPPSPSSRGLRALLLAAVAGGSAYGVTVTKEWVESSPRLPLRTVAVVGSDEQPLSIERIAEVRAFAELEDGEPWLGIKPDEVAERVERHPFVREARVQRRPPDAIEIMVELRSPTAVLRRGERLYLVDEDGEVMKQARPGDVVDLPLIELESRDDAAGALPELGDALAIIEAASRHGLSDRLSEVVAVPGAGFEVVLDDGARARLGASDYDLRIRRLLATEQRLKESGRAFSFMWLDDAQRPERVAVRLRTTTETSPTGG